MPQKGKSMKNEPIQILPLDYEQQMIYSVFVRNHTPEGTFLALERDLDRIQALGTDIIWLLPVHPVGMTDRKGKDGSPYAISDYRTVAPEMGSINDFRHLVDAIHQKGMKCIIDVVYNHTSPDSVLYQNHPEWFYADKNGRPYSIVKEWSDIIDLDYSHSDLQEELISVLEFWAEIVDGFRCDVASRIPLEFWEKARKRISQKHPDLFWLAESTHLPFSKFIRDHGRTAVCDAQLYEVFDTLYDYDVFDYMTAYLKGEGTLSRWMEELERQEAVFPSNFIKLRYLENHDQPRFASFLDTLASDSLQKKYLWKNWTALQFFLKGMPLVYHGQEFMEEHRPTIFDQDPIHISEDMTGAEYIAALSRLHRSLPAHAPIYCYADDQRNLAWIDRNGLRGIFQLKPAENSETPVQTDLEDGIFTNLITGTQLQIQNGTIRTEDLPAVIAVSHCADPSF